MSGTVSSMTRKQEVDSKLRRSGGAIQGAAKMYSRQLSNVRNQLNFGGQNGGMGERCTSVSSDTHRMVRNNSGYHN